MTFGIFASHEGTVLQSVLDACASGRVSARVAVVISNNSTSGALRRASAAGVKALHLSSRTNSDPAALDLAIRDALAAESVDLVVLAELGPLVVKTVAGRILNTHPAVLPRFGGPGMYGDRVYEAVLEAGESRRARGARGRGRIRQWAGPGAVQVPRPARRLGGDAENAGAGTRACARR